MRWSIVIAALVAVGLSLPGVPHSETQDTVLEATFRYEPQERRDPFESLVKEKPLVTEWLPVVDPNRIREPLERFDISALKLVGILWGDLGRRALLRAPDDKGYFVNVGTYMGLKGGRVISIDDDRLVVEEHYKDLEGNIVSKTLSLPLRRKEKQNG